MINLEAEIDKAKNPYDKDIKEKVVLLDYLKDKKELDKLMSNGKRYDKEMQSGVTKLIDRGFVRKHDKVLNNPRILSIYSSMYNEVAQNMTDSGNISSAEKHDMDTMDRAMFNFNSSQCGLSTVSLFPKREWLYLTKKSAVANLNV